MVFTDVDHAERSNKKSFLFSACLSVDISSFSLKMIVMVSWLASSVRLSESSTKRN